MLEMGNRKRKGRGKWVKRGLTLLLGLVVVVLIVAPYMILSQVINGHIDYLGYTTEEYPLQGLYTSADFGLTSKDQFLTTEDGLKVWVSEVQVDEPKGIVIYLSGIQQPSVTYFYGHSKWLKSNGFASILLEVRGHGQSEGNQVALGYEEVLDVQATVDYIKAQEQYKDIPLVIHGVSMGGAVSINAFGQIPEIDGLIAMSAYSSVDEVIYETMGNYGVPSFVASMEKKLVELYLPLFFGEAAGELVPVKQIQNVGNRPALLIAASGDTEVPPVNMERLLSAAPDHTESWLKDSWEHFIVKDCDFVKMEQDTEYTDKILGFLEQVVVYSESE